MADISITAASLIPSANATIIRGTAGATLARGNVVYKNTSNVWVKAKADASGTYAGQGIALVDSASGQPTLILTKDPALAIGATVTEGVQLAVSAANAGAIAPSTDISSGSWKHVFGIMLESNVADVDFENVQSTGSALP